MDRGYHIAPAAAFIFSNPLRKPSRRRCLHTVPKPAGCHPFSSEAPEAASKIPLPTLSHPRLPRHAQKSSQGAAPFVPQLAITT
ncbi:hypothetical protein BGZ61DRAFT_447546 [Ilyonectria robusta]|uniref:uncharacterized protein n=1 Tax=Ilyonectria robusta TaxID=1079257 RepID=UPI001E8D51A6|nr:uncharacterized protein BGZ61DRAFT_447546 [Ilyonectria robusta]KAH8721860.1 hypothetical protein BGZ61DRAFT_447546 [Ilyonectria robusta]